ncbi:MAG: carotenoid 1,2-hydratase [Nitrospirae bacterium]|nr:carotenoid 1,2-hydratase [Nitrospirota bacterium]
MSVCLITLSLFSHSWAGEFRDVTPDSRLSFPADYYYRKDFRVQWWYFTGHLFDAKGREFGYELTFFVVGVQKRHYTSRFGVNSLYISHFALSDVQEKRYCFSDETDSEAFGLAGAKDGELNVRVGNSILDGSVTRMHIRASDGEKALDLTLTPEKPPVLNGEKGYSRKSEDSPLFASLYFSLTDLKTTGSLEIGDTKFSVAGKSWFDRELSSRELSANETGWDWFSLQLDDGREIMLYLIRKKDGSPDRYSAGTFVYPNGSYRHLTFGDFKVTASARYRSKKTGAEYPSRWEVAIPSEHLALTITPLIRDQEFIAAHSTGNHYWEGACKVEGSATGRAYVELTGY